MPYARRLRVSGRLGHRMLALAVLTTLALLALALQAGSANAASLAVEGESLAASPTNDGTVLSDSTASGGRVRELWSNGSMNGSVTLASSADTLTVRARGSQCGGAPHMTAEVDGKQVLSVDVPPTTLTNYAAPITIASGQHSLKISFTNDYLTSSCDRNVYVDVATLSSSTSGGTTSGGTTSGGTTSGGTTSSGPTLFSANFANGFSYYPNQIHPERISVVDDPVLGALRRVLKFTVYQTDTGPTENPRAQLETAYDFKEGQDRYFGTSYYFPAGFPTGLPNGGWITVGSQAYGPPYNGAEPVSLRVQNAVDGSGAELRWQRNATYNWDIPWRGPKIADIRGHWIDVVQRIKLSQDPSVGFVELWMNTGSGWVHQKLSGQDRLYMKTMDASNNGGANNSRLSLYYRSDIPGPLTMYHGAQTIADATAAGVTWQTVAPHSYG